MTNYTQRHFKTDATANEEQRYELETEAIRGAMLAARKSEDEINLVIGNPRLRAAKLMAGKAGVSKSEVARDGRAGTHGLSNGRSWNEASKLPFKGDSRAEALHDAKCEIERTDAFNKCVRGW